MAKVKVTLQSHLNPDFSFHLYGYLSSYQLINSELT